MTRIHTPARRPFIHALLTVLGALSTAHASVLHLRVPLTPTALLQPDAKSVQAGCDAGLQYALAGMAPATAIDGDPTQYSLNRDQATTVVLITAAGSMQNRCYRNSMDSRAILDARSTVAGTLWITVRGSTQTALRDEAQGWHVTLILQNRAGQELGRLEPGQVAAGRPELWTQNCTDINCKWTGENRYGFDLGQLPTRVQAAMAGAARIVVVVDFPVPELMAAQP